MHTSTHCARLNIAPCPARAWPYLAANVTGNSIRGRNPSTALPPLCFEGRGHAAPASASDEAGARPCADDLQGSRVKTARAPTPFTLSPSETAQFASTRHSTVWITLGLPCHINLTRSQSPPRNLASFAAHPRAPHQAEESAAVTPASGAKGPVLGEFSFRMLPW